ncbi:hypothetical protein ACVMGC_004230 [Bradyrhizobium barranii subsp. barranii]
MILTQIMFDLIDRELTESGGLLGLIDRELTETVEPDRTI